MYNKKERKKDTSSMHKSSFFQCEMPHNNNHGHITIRSNTLQWLTTDDKPFIQLDNILSQNSNYITSEYKYNQIPSPCSLRAGRATGILFLRKIYAIAGTQRDIGSFRVPFQTGIQLCRNADDTFATRFRIDIDPSIPIPEGMLPFKSPRKHAACIRPVKIPFILFSSKI